MRRSLQGLGCARRARCAVDSRSHRAAHQHVAAAQMRTIRQGTHLGGRVTGVRRTDLDQPAAARQPGSRHACRGGGAQSRREQRLRLDQVALRHGQAGLACRRLSSLDRSRRCRLPGRRGERRRRCQQRQRPRTRRTGFAPMCAMDGPTKRAAAPKWGAAAGGYRSAGVVGASGLRRIPRSPCPGTARNARRQDWRRWRCLAASPPTARRMPSLAT